MNSSLIVAMSAAPLYAQRAIIKSDKAKPQVYCEINDLGEQIDEADQKMDDNKAAALSRTPSRSS